MRSAPRSTISPVEVCKVRGTKNFHHGVSRAGRSDAVVGRPSWFSCTGGGKTERRNPRGGAGGGARR